MMARAGRNVSSVGNCVRLFAITCMIVVLVCFTATKFTTVQNTEEAEIVSQYELNDEAKHRKWFRNSHVVSQVSELLSEVGSEYAAGAEYGSKHEEGLLQAQWNGNEQLVSEDQVAECDLNLEQCAPRVEFEIFSRYTRRPLCKTKRAARNCESCLPQIRKIPCQVHSKFVALPGLACRNQELTVEEYNFETQSDCLRQLAQHVRNADTKRIPRIGHAVYFYGANSTMKFHQHLSVLSLVRQLRPAVFFFWNDGLPQGRWMSELLLRLQARRAPEWLGVPQRNYSVRFVSVRRERPMNIYNSPIIRAEHASDVARLEALLLFGGVYLDFDAFAVNRLDALLNKPFVLGYELDAHLTDAVILGEPNASFAVLYHCEYTDFNPYGWIEHSALRPHTLAQRCPHLIHREERSLCQPSNYAQSDGMRLLYGNNVQFDLSHNFAVHSFMWTFQGTDKLNPGWILRMNNTMGSIWRSIYYVLPLTQTLPLNDTDLPA